MIHKKNSMNPAAENNGCTGGFSPPRRLVLVNAKSKKEQERELDCVGMLDCGKAGQSQCLSFLVSILSSRLGQICRL